MNGALARLIRRAFQECRILWAERRCSACLHPFVPEDHGREIPADSAFSAVLNRAFCPSCRPFFRQREAGYCPYCGEPSALADSPVMPCGDCLQKLPPWDEFLFCGIYEGPLRELLLDAKFSGGLTAQAVLGELLAARCSEHYSSSARPDFIIPMPLHESRLMERGYDQCVELARPLAKALGLPLRYDVLQRVIASPPQSRLSREQRKKLPQPFSTLSDVSGAHILLIDDVCTTGATLSRAAEALRSAGARRIDAAVIARTSRHTAQAPSENKQHANRRNTAAYP